MAQCHLGYVIVSEVGMLRTTSIDRRRFLQFSGATGTVLALAFSAEGLIVNADAAEAPRDFVPNGYLHISASGIVLFAPNPEIGQGVKTLRVAGRYRCQNVSPAVIVPCITLRPNDV